MSTKAQANSYVQKAKRNQVQRKGKITGKDMKEAAIETGKDIAIGAVGGGLAGALLGRGSLIGGVLVSFAGHLKKNRLISAFGMGMMASSGFIKPAETTVNGTESNKAEEAKSRLKQFGTNLKQKLWIDKFLKKKDTNQQADELGDVKYFSYPSGDEVGMIDLSELDRVEQAIQMSAQDYEGQVNGDFPDEMEDERIY